MPCEHRRLKNGPNIPRVYGSWASEICEDCGAWRTMTHAVRGLDGQFGSRHHFSDWHPTSELAAALNSDVVD